MMARTQRFFVLAHARESVTSAPLGNKLITLEQVTCPGSGLSSAPGGIAFSLLILPPSCHSLLCFSSASAGQQIDKTHLPFPPD